MSAARYAVGRWDGALPQLDGRTFDPAREPFCAREFARIDRYPWGGEGYCPEARAYLAWTRDALLVLMCAREEKVYVRERNFGGPVCEDSCLEFFLNARPSRGGVYVNVEVNAGGVMHIGVGAAREGRRVLSKRPEGVEVSHSRHAGDWWAVSYALPFALLRALFGGEAEREMRGNFYACEEIARPHFGCWSPVHAPRPDFHRPECFGAICLED